MSKAECEKHYWHVCGGMVMCVHRIGRARRVAAKVVDVVTALIAPRTLATSGRRPGVRAKRAACGVAGRQL